MLRYLSADIICSENRTVFRERSIFSPQMVVIVFIILQILFSTRAVLKIGEYSRIFPSFSWGIFGHVTCLDQSRASERIWWIISAHNRFKLKFSFKSLDLANNVFARDVTASASLYSGVSTVVLLTRLKWQSLLRGGSGACSPRRFYVLRRRCHFLDFEHKFSIYNLSGAKRN